MRLIDLSGWLTSYVTERERGDTGGTCGHGSNANGMNERVWGDSLDTFDSRSFFEIGETECAFVNDRQLNRKLHLLMLCS